MTNVPSLPGSDPDIRNFIDSVHEGVFDTATPEQRAEVADRLRLLIALLHERLDVSPLDGHSRVTPRIPDMRDRERELTHEELLNARHKVTEAELDQADWHTIV